jgi:hypothetical protein
MAWTTRHATMQCPEGVRDQAGGCDAGFRWRPWGPQENSSLGKALDPKLEGGRPRAALSPRISGVLCAYW